MTKKLTLTNEKIYTYAINLLSNITDDINLPVKINFYLQKNMNKFTELGQEIEKSRLSICEKYGTLDEDGNSFIIADENTEIAANEIKDLLALTQEVKINLFNLDDLEGIDLTSKQLAAISFMIKDNYDDED